MNQVTRHEQFVNCELTAFRVSRVTTCEPLVAEVQYIDEKYRRSKHNPTTENDRNIVSLYEDVLKKCMCVDIEA